MVEEMSCNLNLSTILWMIIICTNWLYILETVIIMFINWGVNWMYFLTLISKGLQEHYLNLLKLSNTILLSLTEGQLLHWESEAQADKIFQECALIQSRATLVALWVEPIKVLSMIGQRTSKHSWINFNCPWLSDSHGKLL